MFSTVSISFSRFFSFLPVIQVLYFVFLIFHDLQFSRHTPGPIMCISHFPRFWVFLSIFQVKHFVFFIFEVFQFSSHIPGPTVCFFIFHGFHCFFPYSRSYTVCFSFSKVFSFFAITQILLVYFSFFMFYTVSHHIPGPTVCTSHFPRFWVV